MSSYLETTQSQNPLAARSPARVVNLLRRSLAYSKETLTELEASKRYPCVSLSAPNGSKVIDSAVTLLVFLKHDAPFVLVTKRTQNLRYFPGVTVFPGGKRNVAETERDTALRELGEEIGVSIPSEAVLGQFPPVYRFYESDRVYKISPFIAFLNELPTLKLNPAEVESTLAIPVPSLVEGSSVPGPSDIPLLGVTRFIFDGLLATVEKASTKGISLVDGPHGAEKNGAHKQAVNLSKESISH